MQQRTCISMSLDHNWPAILVMIMHESRLFRAIFNYGPIRSQDWKQSRTLFSRNLFNWPLKFTVFQGEIIRTLAKLMMITLTCGFCELKACRWWRNERRQQISVHVHLVGLLIIFRCDALFTCDVVVRLDSPTWANDFQAVAFHKYVKPGLASRKLNHRLCCTYIYWLLIFDVIVIFALSVVGSLSSKGLLEHQSLRSDNLLIQCQVFLRAVNYLCNHEDKLFSIGWNNVFGRHFKSDISRLPNSLSFFLNEVNGRSAHFCPLLPTSPICLYVFLILTFCYCIFTREDVIISVC